MFKGSDGKWQYTDHLGKSQSGVEWWTGVIVGGLILLVFALIATFS